MRYVAVVLALVVSCKKPVPSCERVWEHITGLVPTELRATFESKQSREVAACKAGAITDDQKRCAVAARDFGELSRCGAVSDGEPRAAETPAPTRPAPTAVETHEIRDAILRFADDDQLRGTPVQVTGYLHAIDNDRPLTKHGVRIYPVVLSDGLDGGPSTMCNVTSPVVGFHEGERVRASGNFAGDPDRNPELAQVQLDDCVLAKP